MSIEILTYVILAIVCVVAGMALLGFAVLSYFFFRKMGVLIEALKKLSENAFPSIDEKRLRALFDSLEKIAEQGPVISRHMEALHTIVDHFMKHALRVPLPKEPQKAWETPGTAGPGVPPDEAEGAYYPTTEADQAAEEAERERLKNSSGQQEQLVPPEPVIEGQ